MKQEIQAKALNCKDGSRLKWEADDSVTKIVLGELGTGNEKVGLHEALPANLRELYPSLTHLHIWNVDLDQELAGLPTALKCLDIRGGKGLKRIRSVPAGLETLGLEDCEALQDFGLGVLGRMEGLEDLSLSGCVGVPVSQVDALLAKTPHLKRLDLSGLAELESVERWPQDLERIDLNGCERLAELPEVWPQALRRLGLRGARSIRSLRGLENAAVDFLDLRQAENLTELPVFKTFPRTLYLFGSGVKSPPAVAHGIDEDENVAAKTKAFFKDIDAFGSGFVNRCKLLVLGNGEAGKTHLSQLLATGESARELGSTHGVQFWPWTLEMDTGSDVQMQVWDFGGQEIYHGTHRLFASKGSVFTVLWNPDEKRERASDQTSQSYQDEKRPLLYWLDYIHAISDKPSVAVVCSRSTFSTAEIEERLKRDLAGKHEGAYEIFYIDSQPKDGESFGQIGRLRKWLRREVAAHVASEGNEVPSHWEIAQDLIDSSLKARSDDRKRTRIDTRALGRSEFSEILSRSIEEAIEENPEKYGKLKSAVERGLLDLSPARDSMTRLLGFFTDSGWIYWDAGLFEGEIIIDQQWALDGIYSVLDRDDAVYAKIRGHRGRFRQSDLLESCWKNDENETLRYDERERSLLLSYMEQCNLVFKVQNREESGREEDVYVSFEHLLDERQINKRPVLRESGVEVVTRCFGSDRFHKGLWQELVVRFGREYWNNANYYSDGLSLINLDGQEVSVRAAINPLGVGGSLEVSVEQIRPAVRSRKRDRMFGNPVSLQERFDRVVGFVKRVVDDIEWTSTGREMKGFDEIEQDAGRGLRKKNVAGDSAKKIDVFISYTWNPRLNDNGEWMVDNSTDYEGPVNRIEQRLKSWQLENLDTNLQIELMRDSSSLDSGGSILGFMNEGCLAPKIIIVHSRKYFFSTCCMYELDTIFLRSMRPLIRVVVPVGLENGYLDDGDPSVFIEFWESVPKALEKLKAFKRLELYGRSEEVDYKLLPAPPFGLEPESFWKSVSKSFGIIQRRERPEATIGDFKSSIRKFVVSVIDESGLALSWDSRNEDKSLDDIISKLSLEDPGADE